MSRRGIAPGSALGVVRAHHHAPKGAIKGAVVIGEFSVEMGYDRQPAIVGPKPEWLRTGQCRMVNAGPMALEVPRLRCSCWIEPGLGDHSPTDCTAEKDSSCRFLDIPSSFFTCDLPEHGDCFVQSWVGDIRGADDIHGIRERDGFFDHADLTRFQKGRGSALPAICGPAILEDVLCCKRSVVKGQ